MEEYFTRKSTCKMEEVDSKIEKITRSINKGRKTIKQLKESKNELNKEFFCNLPIVIESQNEHMYGTWYTLAILFPSGIRMCAQVHPDAHKKEESFIATLTQWGVNTNIPDWYWTRYLPKSERNIETFGLAKVKSLTWLKELINKHPCDD